MPASWQRCSHFPAWRRRWCRIRCRLWRWAGSWLRCRWIVLSAAGIASITAGIVIFRTGAASGAVVGRRAGVCIGIFGRVCFAVYIVSVGAFRDWIGGNPDAGGLDAALNVFFFVGNDIFDAALAVKAQ